jgi:putative ABC transport system permease protein
MLFRIIKKSFLNQKKAMALMIVAITVGTAVSAALLTVSFDISEKVSRELRAFGANIIIEPKVEGLADISGKKRYLREQDIIKSKTIFWRHNIIGIAPFLETSADVQVNGATGRVALTGSWYERELPLPGEKGNFSAGIKTVSPWWNIYGKWPGTPDEALVGISVSEKMNVRPQDVIGIEGKDFTVSGILETGGREDDRIFLELESLYSLKKMEGMVSRVLVSALSKPMDDFAYRDPDTMSQAEYEKWYCTGYITSIARQLEEVFTGSKARPIWNIAETEGRVLERLKVLIYFLSFVAIAASTIGVSTTMIMSLLRRTGEIGLMKSLGADSSKIIALFLTEGFIIGIVGGLSGYVVSFAVSQYIGVEIFHAGLERYDILLPISIGSAVCIAVAGSVLPIINALRIRPAIVMRGAE